LYMNSFNITLARYRALLLAQQEGRLQLPNDNLDTGGATVPASYKLADDTYAKLLEKISGQAISDELRRELLYYYADLEKPFATKRNPKAWRELVRELNTLKSVPVPLSAGEKKSTRSVPPWRPEQMSWRVGSRIHRLGNCRSNGASTVRS
jgi:hypothetical protein